MRIIVTSDTHRDFHSLRHLVELHRKTADLFIHLGDGAQELSQVAALYPECKWLSVRGNCDYGTEQALAGCFCADTAKIFYTHGHMFNVKFDLTGLLAATVDMQANVALFGHTHIPFVDYQNGIHLMNPGSLGMPHDAKHTYGVVDITPQGIVCFINEL